VLRAPRSAVGPAHPGAFLATGGKPGFHQHHDGWWRVDGKFARFFQEIAPTTAGLFGIFPIIFSDFLHYIPHVIFFVFRGKSQPIMFVIVGVD